MSDTTDSTTAQWFPPRRDLLLGWLLGVFMAIVFLALTAYQTAATLLARVAQTDVMKAATDSAWSGRVSLEIAWFLAAVVMLHVAMGTMAWVDVGEQPHRRHQREVAQREAGTGHVHGAREASGVPDRQHPDLILAGSWCGEQKEPGGRGDHPADPLATGILQFDHGAIDRLAAAAIDHAPADRRSLRRQQRRDDTADGEGEPQEHGGHSGEAGGLPS